VHLGRNMIPEGLRGSLYRNGPARLERGGVRVGHWFDGDGAILAVHFTPLFKLCISHIFLNKIRLDRSSGKGGK